MGPTKWILVAPEGHVIQLSFEVLSLDSQNSLTSVYVRDGDSALSELLMKISGETSKKSVVSSGRVMSVEMESLRGNDGKEEGFMAVYSSLGEFCKVRKSIT